MSGLVEIHQIDKCFGGVKALDGFSFVVGHQEILGLFGPNGAGKTTLFNIMTGLGLPDRGSITSQGRELIGLQPHKIFSLGIARTFQSLRLIRRLTTLENVLIFFDNQPGERLRNVFFRPQRCAVQEEENRERALSLIEMAGLAEEVNSLADNMSYGQQKLLSLVCCLATSAELLLLDEPIAGIAPAMIERILSIIERLPGQGKSVIVIEHNVEALEQICHRLIFMDAGRKICEGTPNQVLCDPKVIEAYLD